MNIFNNRKPIYDKVIGFYRLKIFHSTRSVNQCYLTLDIPKTGEYHRIQANDHLYGLLLTCAMNKDDNAVKRALDVYLSVNALLFSSKQSISAFVATVNSLTDGLFIQAKEAAAAVTEEQNKADEALMNDAVEYADMPKKERKKRKKAMADAVKDIINEETNKKHE